MQRSGFEKNQGLRCPGDSFSEKEFHDTLLSYGRIPIKLIRAGVLGEELPEY